MQIIHFYALESSMKRLNARLVLQEKFHNFPHFPFDFEQVNVSWSGSSDFFN